MKIIILLLMILHLPCADEAYSRIIQVPESVNDLGRIIDADFGADSKKIASIFEENILGGKEMSKESATLMNSAYLYIQLRFMGQGGRNDHLHNLLKNARKSGIEKSRYDTVDGVLIAYLAYKNSGKYKNVEFDCSVITRGPTDVSVPNTELNLQQ